MTITLEKFNKSHPVVAEGVRVINQLPPASTISYLTYRGWVQGKRKISVAYRIMLFLKGIKV